MKHNRDPFSVLVLLAINNCIIWFRFPEEENSQLRPLVFLPNQILLYVSTAHLRLPYFPFISHGKPSCPRKTEFR